MPFRKGSTDEALKLSLKEKWDVDKHNAKKVYFLTVTLSFKLTVEIEAFWYTDKF